MSSKFSFLRTPTYQVGLHSASIMALLWLGVPIPVWLLLFIGGIAFFLCLYKSPERQEYFMKICFDCYDFRYFALVFIFIILLLYIFFSRRLCYLPGFITWFFCICLVCKSYDEYTTLLSVNFIPYDSPDYYSTTL